MKYKVWRIWVKQLPLALKWFVVLILLRPIIDVFYFLKDISPLLSPLYIAGVLTPILIGLSFLSRKFPRKFPSLISDTSFSLWAILLLFNILLLTVIEEGFQLFGNLLRYTAPILLYFYMRHFVRSKKDLHGLLQTFFYSALIPALLLLYELAVGPINPQYLSESRGGAARFQGGYADIMNYAIYALGALLIQFYFFLVRSRIRQNLIKHKVTLLATIIVCFTGLVAIKQSSSWGTAIFIIMLFMLFNMNTVKGVVIMILLAPFILLGGHYTYKTKIEPLLKRELMVIEGEKDIDRSFNGRMARWKGYFDEWSNMSLMSNVFGVTISGEKKASVMISGGMHSDYVRILFMTGIVGIALYLLFLITILRKIKQMRFPERFLVLGTLSLVLILSVTTTPLLYIPLLYLIMPVFAYAALPKPLLKASNA